MAKAPYKDFSIYMLRHYIKKCATESISEADRLNREAAKIALDELGTRNRCVAMRVLGSITPVQESVYNCWQETGISEPEIWDILTRLYRRVAELRGLV